MSDDFLIVVPRDPAYMPSARSQKSLIEAIHDLVPTADEVSSESFEHIAFFDSGANFQSVTCVSCAAPLEMPWWRDRMSEDFGGQGFTLKRYALPCCGARLSLNELRYEWPQAFARFCVEARNPGIGELAAAELLRLEQALGAPVVIVRRHL